MKNNRSGKVDPIVWIAGGLVAFGAWQGGYLGSIGGPGQNRPNVVDTVSVNEPTESVKGYFRDGNHDRLAELKEAAKQLSNAEKEALRNFYMDFGNIVLTDPDVAKTTADIRATHIAAGKTKFRRMGINDKYDGLDDAVNNAFGAGIGLETRPLTDADRTKAKEVAHAMAWVFDEA